VLISVRAAGCGPDVWHIMAGKPNLVRAIPEVRRALRSPRGRDVAGVVERVGANVTDFVSGDEVMGVVEGSFAEVAAGDPAKLARKPAQLSFEEAAAVPISATTALQALRDVSDVHPGRRVLIVGAGGGVGTFAVQIAKAFGAEVTGVCSAEKAELVRSLGADDVIDYTKEDFTDGARRWDVIVDCAGRRPLRHLRRALTPNGALAIVGGDGGGEWTGGFFRQMLRAPLASLFTGQKLRPVTAKTTREDLEGLNSLIQEGKLKPVVDRTFALPEAADAIRYLERGHATGKIVVTVSYQT
jgi:NADPH:quinone reductase-like Zn-dependent oxidoreductase